MAHEVVKRVGARAYRYRVERVRDEASGKPRQRWTYLGTVASADAAAPAPKRRAPERTRERLIDAFERLVEREPAGAVSAGAIATEAGVAHGTFYRHFTDKRAVLIAALDRVRDEFDRGSPWFDPPYGTADVERARVREWTLAKVRHIPKRAGILRAWLEALETDPVLREQRLARRRARVAALEDYLENLARASIVPAPVPTSLATALLALIDAMFRESVVDPTGTEAALADGIVETFDRAIFGVPSAARTSVSTASAMGSRPAGTV